MKLLVAAVSSMLLINAALLVACSASADKDTKAYKKAAAAFPAPICFGTVVQTDSQNLRIECNNGRVVTVRSYKYSLKMGEGSK